MIFNTNLPGSSIQVIDEYNTTTYDTSLFGTTESVLVIGTAFDGPVGKEIAIYNPDQAKYIFGGTYDAVAKRSASLVAYIQDLYEKGARTIYAMRVGGKDIQKVYRLREDVPIYLKVSGAFPSNKYKDMALLVDLAGGKIDIYKTASKATIEEKREGYVESNESIIKTRIGIGAAYTYDVNSPLTDFVEYLNNYTRNNVFRFSLVNEKGEDVTYSEAAKSLSVGALADGVYTIGRVNSGEGKATVLTAVDAEVGYTNYAGNFVFKVTSNNDIEAPWPYVSGDYSFLERFGGLDTVSKKDAIDYEEVKMSNFDFYKKLGSGYAQTAQITATGVIKPTQTTNPNYTVEIGEGIYTIASNLKTDYRILTGVYADDTITSANLTQKDFLKENVAAIPAAYITNKNEKGVVETVVAANAYYKLDDDNTASYGFNVRVETGALVDEVTKAAFDVKFNTKTVIKSDDDLKTGEYGIVEAENAYWVAIGVDGKPSILMPLNMLGNKNPDYLISIKKDAAKTIYTITLSQAFSQVTTAHELAKILNESAIGQVFNITYNNSYANDIITATPNPTALTGTSCRSITVDTNLVLPYTTSDNFVRQLAQHCEYTSLKTYQTHGALGTSPLGDVSIKSVTGRAKDLVEKDYDLYVKNAVGKPVLDVDNLPYHIGKAVSIVVAQHTIQTLDGYRFIAASHASYIGRASTLDTSISTTNQTITIAPHYTFGESQKVALNKAGYVTIENKNGVYKVTDGITQAPIYSKFSRFATFRTIKIVDRIIRDATEPFIGKKNDMVNRNSMYTAIKSGLDAILDTYLEKYTFSMQYNKYESRLGNVNIDYSFDIIDEIRNVNNTVRVKS